MTAILTLARSGLWLLTIPAVLLGIVAWHNPLAFAVVVGGTIWLASVATAAALLAERVDMKRDAKDADRRAEVLEDELAQALGELRHMRERPEPIADRIVQVGSQPPFSVDYIDPKVCGGRTDRWFVMGTVDGNPRNPQGPVAICEYEPSAHTIAALLNAYIEPPPSGLAERMVEPAKAAERPDLRIVPPRTGEHDHLRDDDAWFSRLYDDEGDLR